jgi:type III secretion protein Q
VNALPVEIPEEEAPVPLERSRHLLRISESGSALARLYGLGPLCVTVGGEIWRFQWRCLVGPMSGALCRVRIGDTEVLVGLESLSTFGAAAEIETAIPALLHVAYLNGLGDSVWRELEALTQQAIDVFEVRLDESLDPDAECLGFEVGRDPEGPATRGVVRFVGTDAARNAELQSLLTAVSRREMRAAPVRSELSLRWVVEVGRTSLAVADVRGLEEQDVVLLDDVKPTSNGLHCRLNVGAARSHAGYVLLRKGGQLQMIQFGRIGDSEMSSDTEAPVTAEAGFDDIPVSLRFEVAQWNASLAEVSQLAPGAVIDLRQRVDEQAVSVWIEQRCIGKGQLVAIGERLGVRLLSVFTREHA